PEAEFYFYEIPFEKALENIVEKIPVQYTCIFCKTIMFRVAERVASIENAKAIVTGESLGQVASQTLDNIYVISRDLRIPVLRPLIGFDKEEIVSLAKNIGTYDVSARSIVECKASPSSRGSYAVAHAKLEIIKKYWVEHRLDKVVDEITKLRIKINLP
ncbi:MAG: tRNA 4-thiouridine(8) synthase ThiI, partial [Thermoprotei archaeon]